MPRFEDRAFAPTTWTVVDSQTNATATATRAATAGKQHFITGISFSMSAQPAAAVTVLVRDGATVLDQFQIPAAAQAPLVHNYHPPLQITTGNAATITVGALGAGVVGTVVLKGKTFNAN
jgi:hypothetical protein